MILKLKRLCWELNQKLLEIIQSKYPQRLYSLSKGLSETLFIEIGITEVKNMIKLLEANMFPAIDFDSELGEEFDVVMVDNYCVGGYTYQGIKDVQTIIFMKLAGITPEMVEMLKRKFGELNTIEDYVIARNNYYGDDFSAAESKFELIQNISRKFRKKEIII